MKEKYRMFHTDFGNAWVDMPKVIYIKESGTGSDLNFENKHLLVHESISEVLGQ